MNIVYTSHPFTPSSRFHNHPHHHSTLYNLITFPLTKVPTFGRQAGRSLLILVNFNFLMGFPQNFVGEKISFINISQ